METEMHTVPRHRSLTIEVSVSTTGDCIPQRQKRLGRSMDIDRGNRSWFSCGLLPLLVITFCTISTMLSMYENTSLMMFLRKPSSSSTTLTSTSITSTPTKSITVPKESIKEIPYQIQNSMQNERMKHHRPFPRWGRTMADEEIHGIDFHRVMDFVMNSSSAAYAPGVKGQKYIPLSDHQTDVGRWYPEVLYVLDHYGLHVSDRHRNTVVQRGGLTVRDKFVPVETKMLDAYHMLWKDTTYSFETWPHLSSVILKNATDGDLESSGFPFLMWHGDYTGCNYLNWKDLYSIPLFTVAASDACNFTFPFPNYGNAVDSSLNWDAEIQLANLNYPWENKVPQIFWRGGLTGDMPDMEHKSPRWKMMEHVHSLEEEYNDNATLFGATSSSPRLPFLFNFSATRLPGKHKMFTPHAIDKFGEFAKSMPMEDFQRFRGILDMDGNSWSMRFGRLLCYNSVVLKVEPTWVEYFYYKDSWFQDEPKLQAWVHYIPVKADLSDLLEISQFVVDPANDEFLQTMVQSANTWCRRNVAKRQIAIDMLNIWERYLQMISTNNPNWVQEQWKPAKEAIFDPTSPFQMNDTSVGFFYEKNKENPTI